MAAYARKNDRREIRRAMSLECAVVRERDYQLVAEHALDVSPDGMLVATSDLALGEKVYVQFQATALGIWFATEATVARIIQGRRPNDRGRAAGLSFSTLSRVKRFILRGHLKKVPPPIPRRAQRIDWARTMSALHLDFPWSPA